MFLSVLFGVLLALLLFALIASFVIQRLILAAAPALLPRLKAVPDCAVPNAPATIRALGQNTRGGVFVGPAGQPVTIPANLTLRINQDLTVVSDLDLVVDGNVTLLGNAAGEAVNPSANITLVSRQGSVKIGAGAFVGRDPALLISSAAAVTAVRAQGTAGRNGGYVRILAPNAAVQNKGRVEAQAGESGGNATGTPVLGFFGADATGGGGGHGGDVRICHLDGLDNQGDIIGGWAGGGGTATATGGGASGAATLGGPGGLGGDVYLEGLAAPGPVQVANANDIEGGLGGPGGGAVATGGAFGTTDADGGAAGKGGSVVFANVEMAPVGSLRNASGGTGGFASATGRGGGVAVVRTIPGLPNVTIGLQGGSSTADGGDGGADGPTPPIPVPPGNPPGAWGAVITANPNHIGAGGDAVAIAGAGGTGNVRSGSSGSCTATGGTGKGGAAATPVSYGPVPAGPAGGGPGSGPMRSPGTP